MGEQTRRLSRPRAQSAWDSKQVWAGGCYGPEPVSALGPGPGPKALHGPALPLSSCFAWFWEGANEILACLEIGFPKRKKVPSGRLCEPRRRVAVYLRLRRQPPGTGPRSEQAGKERGLAGGFREVPEPTGAWRGPGLLHACALTHRPGLAACLGQPAGQPQAHSLQCAPLPPLLCGLPL